MDKVAQAGVEPLIPKHGGYRKLKTWQLARLIYDVTVRFCDRFIDRRSRTHDQMVQAARSGVQNIAEGSQDSGTSKKIELKLTNIARGSLEELRNDYIDFLRQRELPEWPPEHPVLLRFKARCCATLEDFREWVAAEVRRKKTRTNTDEHSGHTDEESGVAGLCQSVFVSVLVANAALSLLNLCCFLLDRQLAAQAKAFETEGGFTERLYRVRSARRSAAR
jgi:four helix bundle suffix protein